MASVAEISVLVGGVIVVAGIAYLMQKNSHTRQNDTQSIKKLLSDEDRYRGDKRIVFNAIQENDWDTLEELLKDNGIKEFPDLINMIKEALKQK